MATFNFAKAKGKGKDLSDTHTEMRLKEQHEKAPEVITEKQLDRDRDGEVEVTTEKQLEKVRTGGADVIIEKNLSDSKGMFGSDHRNVKAYEGDINKLEEKRLSNKKVEDEKYSAASETPKQVKWWENLKKAQSNKVTKTAQEENPFDSSERFQRIKGYDPDAEGILPDEDIIPDVDEEAKQLGEEDLEKEIAKDPVGKMYVTKNKEGQAPLPHVYMELSFDPLLFKSDEEAKEAAMEKVLEARPNLVGKLDISDFSEPERGAIDSTIKLRLVGEEYFAAPEAEESSPFLNVEYEDIDMGGTPMTVGKVALGPQAEAMDESLIQEVRDYIAEKTGIEVPESAIQVNLEKGEVTFAFSAKAEDPLESTTPTPQAAIEDISLDADIPSMTEEEEASDVFADDELDEEVDKITPTAKSIYDFPIVIADAKDVSKDDSKKN